MVSGYIESVAKYIPTLYLGKFELFRLATRYRLLVPKVMHFEMDVPFLPELKFEISNKMSIMWFVNGNPML